MKVSRHVLTVATLAVLVGGASVSVAADGHSSVPPTGSTNRVTSTLPIHSSLAQLNAQIADAADPGLPSVVGSVNGEPITGKQVAQMEMALAGFTDTGMGSASLRTQAFDSIVQQYVMAQVAQKQGLYPAMSQVKQQALSNGLPTTTQELVALQAADGSEALRAQYLKGKGLGPNDYGVWDGELQTLVHQANVKLNATF